MRGGNPGPVKATDAGRDAAAEPKTAAAPTNVGAPDSSEAGRSTFSLPKLPSVSMPKGGGAIRGIGEKLSMSPATGTASFSIPVATTPGRSSFDPSLALRYDSGAGNGPFGLGWQLGVPAITRKTDKGLPRYEDDDVFLLSGAEDLVRVSEREEGPFAIARYRPRTEGLFARIERWTDSRDRTVHWRVTTNENVTSFYGLTMDGRIHDPADDLRVFSWLLERTEDDRGNIAVYGYRREDGAGVDRTLAEESRFDPKDPSSFIATAQRYLKRIAYANRTPFVDDAFCFEVVLDYGEHDAADPKPNDDTRPGASTWKRRADAFSSYKAGFEVRTYRRCERILMFHRFDELGPEPVVVRSLELEQREMPTLTRLEKVTQRGWVRAGNAYRTATLPSLVLSYTERKLHDEAHALDARAAGGLPGGFSAGSMQWQDLDGEGLPGLLVASQAAWLYARNEGGGKIAAPQVVRSMPAPGELAGGVQQLTDVDGDGRLELVSYTQPLAGHFSRAADGTFSSFSFFPELPAIDWNEPNLRFIDLDGDGHADVLVSEDRVFTWYRSRAKQGFEAARWAPKPVDGTAREPITFADGTETIHLADMSGDGLVDIVRVRNGEVVYWPNLGWGSFGAKVTMDTSPRFASDAEFDGKRVRFADVDGSGTTDIIYLGTDGATVFYNQSGNSWSLGERIRSLPPSVPPEQISALDLLGNGTACLVWSSPLPGLAPAPVRYVDLMGGEKPHLLRTVDNNLGLRTTVEHASSTRYYLDDAARGEPWITRLPFPVQVVSRVVHEDLVARTSQVTRYAFHHGYFDGEEREFGGFARVDQWDEEALAHGDGDPLALADSADVLRLAPVRTTTWFHTGAWLEQVQLEQALRKEYGPRDGQGRLDPLAPLLPDTPRDPAWSVRDEKEAVRALRGSTLRQEVYAEDGSDRAHLPYSVTEASHRVERLRPSGKGEDDFGVFLVVPDQSFSVSYERQLDDARIQHTMTLDTDEFGNVLDEVAIAYGRATAAIAPVPGVPGIARANVAQKAPSIVRTMRRFTSPIDAPSIGIRTPLPCESRIYEITGLTPTALYFTPDEIRHAVTTLREHSATANGSPQRRKVEHTRTFFRSDDLALVLPLGQTGARALPHEEYQLAITPDLLRDHLVRPRADGTNEALVGDPPTELGVQGGYVARSTLVQQGLFPAETAVGDESGADWWAPSGRILLSPGVQPNTLDPADVELAFAREHFFHPYRQRDPFGAFTRIAFDPYQLLPAEAVDAIGNRTVAGEHFDDGTVTPRIDYRVVQPAVISDANRNRVELAYDALGMVVATATRGKPDPAAPIEGDSLDQLQTDLSEPELAQYLADPVAAAGVLLKSATTRFIYDVRAFERTRSAPDVDAPMVHTLKRETHVSKLAPGQTTRIQLAFAYFDGLGRELQQKVLAEPVRGSTATRWLGSGCVVRNNKGLPVRKYEPFFSTTHRYERDAKHGVSSTLFYDPVGRVVATLHPDHTYEKVVFTPWHQEAWDANDTVKLDPTIDPHVGADIKRLPAAEVLPTWYQRRKDAADVEGDAARQAARHAETPTATHLDPLGRPILVVTDNKLRRRDGTDERRFAGTFTELDVEGFERSVRDALDREVMRYIHDLRGRRIRTRSMDAGDRWMLADVADQPIRAWDARGHTLATEYDALRRPTKTTLSGQRDAPGPVVFSLTEYGEGQPEYLNARGKPIRVLDTAGEVRLVGRAAGATQDEAYDFRGNAIFSTRRLARDYKKVPNWAQPDLDQEAFTTETRVDALGRAIWSRSADGSIDEPRFNLRGLLDAVDVQVRGQGGKRPIVTAVDYDQHGQRLRVAHGNAVVTTYEHDPITHRLVALKTRRPAAAWPNDASDPADPEKRPTGVQLLAYTYDPVGNITAIRDDAQPTIFFAGQVTDGHQRFEYDALYQLRRAEGREHIGQAGAPHTTWNDEGRRALPHPNQGNAMRPYVEHYDYDDAGNLLEIAHRAELGGDWTRSFEHESPSRIDATTTSNALSRSLLGDNAEYVYPHDQHGNMLGMPHLPHDSTAPLSGMMWDAFDRLASSSRQSVANGGTPETTYYTYDASGERVRKVTESYAAPGAAPIRMHERLYLGGSELYRRYDGDGSTVSLERETLHISDDSRRVALIESRTIGNDGSAAELIRYQHANHLGTATVELDAEAKIISYEEYHPYGSKALHSVRSQTETPKRYRYTGKERDEETGLSYHSARYYAPWLARWTSADPGEPQDGLNSFWYACNGPVGHTDGSGRETDFSGFNELVRDLANDPNVQRKLDFTPAPIPAAPPGTNFDNAGRAGARRFVPPGGAPPGMERNHFVKQIPAAAARVHPNITNDPGYMRLLNARNANQATTLLVSTKGGPTRYVVSGDGTSGSPARAKSRRYGNEHTLADRHLGNVELARNKASANPRNAVVDAGRTTQWRLTGDAGPAPPGGAPSPATPNPTRGDSIPQPSALSRVGSALRGGVGAVRDAVNRVGTAAARATRATATGALGLTRAVVPGVAEGELALGAASVAAYSAGLAKTGAALAVVAEAVPVVGGGAAAGAFVGNVAERTATSLGASSGTAKATGALAAAGSGAGAGALIGSVIPGIGTAVGAVVGGAAGLIGYGLSKLF